MTTNNPDQERRTASVVRHLPDKGFCFLRDKDGREYFAHRSVMGQLAFDALKVGSTVTFVPKLGDKGWRAIDVEVV